MAILRTCCCWKSVRSGSFACGIYTMIFYTLVVAIGAFHINPAIENKVLLAFGLLALLLSGICVMTSALLLVGLCVDNRSLLLPWIISISTMTVLDVFLSFYLITDWADDPYLALFFLTDFFVCGINVYCLLCVVSQYQEYLAGRGRPEDCLRIESPVEPRALRFHWPSFQVLSNPPFGEPVVDAARAKPTNFLSVPDPELDRVRICNNSTSSNEACSTSRLIIGDKVKEDISIIESSPPSTRSIQTD